MSEKYVNINDRSEFVDALADLLTSCHAKHKSGCFAPDCRECIDRFFGISNGHLLPAADIAPVRHGEWQEINGIFSCSRCGYSFEHEGYKHFFNYCPNCGAKLC